MITFEPASLSYLNLNYNTETTNFARIFSKIQPKGRENGHSDHKICASGQVFAWFLGCHLGVTK
jgi:hypothetical protein